MTVIRKMDEALAEEYIKYGRIMPVDIFRKEDPMDWEAVQKMFDENVKQFRGLLYDGTRERAKEIIDDIIQKVDAESGTDLSSLTLEWWEYDELIDALLDDEDFEDGENIGEISTEAGTNPPS